MSNWVLTYLFFIIEKYWKKYQYASKFVQLVKSKTPKVTLYTKYAKVMLMENSPTADLEVCFYDGELNVHVETCDPTEGKESNKLPHKHWCFIGAKTHKTSELVRVVEKSGKSYTVKGEVGLSGLSPESRLYVELSDEGHSMCLSLEAAITAEEQRSTKNVPFFPITIGRWVESAGLRILLVSLLSSPHAVNTGFMYATHPRRPVIPDSLSLSPLPSHPAPPDAGSPPQPPQITPSVSVTQPSTSWFHKWINA